MLSHVFDILKAEKMRRIEGLKKYCDDEKDDELELQLKEDHQRQEQIEEEIFDLLDEQALLHFWWPSKEENDAYWRRWQDLPRKQQKIDPLLKGPWDFSSMVESILTGEYKFVSCQLLAPDRGVLVFLPYSFPYGGSGAIQALIEACDCEILGAERGDGYISYE
jgi:hypothetical protein